jgi:hypothetical protein
MLSAPVLALTLCNFAQSWAAYTLMTELPTYLLDFHFDLKQAGLWSDVPTLGPIVFCIPVATRPRWRSHYHTPLLFVFWEFSLRKQVIINPPRIFHSWFSSYAANRGV